MMKKIRKLSDQYEMTKKFNDETKLDVEQELFTILQEEIRKEMILEWQSKMMDIGE